MMVSEGDCVSLSWDPSSGGHCARCWWNMAGGQLNTFSYQHLWSWDNDCSFQRWCYDELLLILWESKVLSHLDEINEKLCRNPSSLTGNLLIGIVSKDLMERADDYTFNPKLPSALLATLQKLRFKHNWRKNADTILHGDIAHSDAWFD